MKSGFIDNMPWFRTQTSSDMDSTLEPNSTLLVGTREKPRFDVKLWGWSLISFIPLVALNSKDKPTTINRGLRKRALPRGGVENEFRGTPLRFKPYVSKVPWHTGARAFLSQLFPRYGHYCGPNWSSGKDNGSLIWDKRPIDWLDFCCYCHDIGYDSHDQAKLLKADLAFLECLERPNMTTKGDVHIAHLYKTMCITGLKNLLIPYRTHLLKLQSAKPLIQFGWLSNVSWKSWSVQKS
ncbi:Phospholipase A2 domain containing protein [Trema orientale]|uniref:Phospholipase A2 domain containing protein n=1 Tax=Trema orientale TaxID=63057 RepID=A0A2P5FIJ7_TREOI|nr:Phospholipase A2 domain containing protein [Trema orientale]